MFQEAPRIIRDERSIILNLPERPQAKSTILQHKRDVHARIDATVNEEYGRPFMHNSQVDVPEERLLVAKNETSTEDSARWLDRQGSRQRAHNNLYLTTDVRIGSSCSNHVVPNLLHARIDSGWTKQVKYESRHDETGINKTRQFQHRRRRDRGKTAIRSILPTGV